MSLPTTHEGVYSFFELQADLIDGPLEFIIAQDDLRYVHLEKGKAKLKSSTQTIKLSLKQDCGCMGDLIQTRVFPSKDLKSYINNKTGIWLDESLIGNRNDSLDNDDFLTTSDDEQISDGHSHIIPKSEELKRNLTSKRRKEVNGPPDEDNKLINTITRLIKSGVTSLTRISRALRAWGMPVNETMIKNLVYLNHSATLYQPRKFRTVKKAAKLRGPQSPGFASADVALLPVVCKGGARYLSTIKMYLSNDKVRYSYRTFSSRSEVIQHLINFLTENPDCHTIRTDNAKEYKSEQCINLLNSFGIRHESIAPGSSFSNGLSERAHQEFYYQVQQHLSQTNLSTRVDLISYFTSAAETTLNLPLSAKPPPFLFGDGVSFKADDNKRLLDGFATRDITSHHRGIYLGHTHSGQCEVLSCTSTDVVLFHVHPNSLNALPLLETQNIIEHFNNNNFYSAPSRRNQTRQIRRKGMGHFQMGYGYFADDEAHPDEVQSGLFDQADTKEWMSIHDNKVMELCMTPNSNPIRTRFRRTWKITSTSERKAKSRFLVCAYKDSRDVESTTFVPSMVDRRLFDIKGLSYEFRCSTIDIKTAFLLVPLEEEVYITLPRHLPQCALDLGYLPNHTYKLLRSLYGLKESPKLFNDFLSDRLIALGWSQYKPGLFYQGTLEIPTALLTAYVDDIKCWAPDPDYLLKLMELSGIPCSDLLPVCSQPQRHVGEDISITNNILTKDISTYLGAMEDHRSNVIAAADSTRALNACNLHKIQKFKQDKDELTPSPSQTLLLQQVAGQLGWLSQCHPAVTARANMIASHVHRPSQFLFKCVHGTLNELRNTPPPPLRYRGLKQPEVRLWVDAAIHDYHSRRGWIIQLVDQDSDITIKDNLIEWKSSSIHATTFSSSTEAEVYALEKMLEEVYTTLNDLHQLFPGSPCRVLSDSNSGLKRITKELNLSLVRGKVSHIMQSLRKCDGVLEHVPGDLQLADALTKIKGLYFYD